MSNTTQALSRIEAILDDSSFVEIGAAVTARATDFNMQEKKAPSDGVITGYGVINGNLVYVYSQDAAVLGGTIGEMHAKKIANLYEKAMKMGAPCIGINDSGGARIQEGINALAGYAEIFQRAVCGKRDERSRKYFGEHTRESRRRNGCISSRHE